MASVKAPRLDQLPGGREGEAEAVGADDVGPGSQRKEFGCVSMWPGYSLQVGGRGRGKARVGVFGLCLTETLQRMT